MRTPLLLSLLLAEIGSSLPAVAAPPVHSDEEEALPPPPAAQAPIAPVAPQAPQAPMPPAAPPPPMYFNGPVYIVPAWPQQPVYPQQPAYPPAAPPVYQQAPQPRVVVRSGRPQPRSEALSHRFGIGARPTGMWLSQRLYGSDLLMLGGGVQARLRVASQVALEATFDVIGKNIHEGVFDRRSYPIQVAALFYAMPPRLATHFNVYGAIGGGLMPSQIALDDHNYPKQELKATELIGQAGVGCELRMWRISLNADARVVGTYRTGDDAYFASFVRPDSGANSLGLTQQALNDKSYGWTFSLGAMLWL